MSQSLITAVLLLAVLAFPESHGQSCRAGWFGQGCMYKCHCVLSPDCRYDDGTCPRNESCAHGFFGPGCQYADLAQTHSSSDIPNYLNDRTDRTCYPGSFTRITYLSMKQIVHGAWFRLAVSDPQRLLKFTLRINTYYSCTDEVRHVVAPTVVDVVCSSGFMIRDLTITGPATEKLCTINISGGRNIALKQFANQSTTYDTLSEAGNAVDGNTDSNFYHGSCARTNSGLRPRWSLHFLLPTMLLRAVLTNSDTNTLQEFTLEVYSGQDVIYSYTNPYYRRSQPTFEVSLMSVKPVTRLDILGTAGYPQRMNALQFCEIEVYGDYLCDGKYGLSCEKQCYCRRIEVCSQNHGVCTPTCPPGRFGERCDRSCSTSCLESLCEPQSGICFSCTGYPYEGEFCMAASEMRTEESGQMYLWALVPLALVMLVSPVALYLCLHRKKSTRQPSEVARVSATAMPA
ncbi:hypothetical protein BsWGS_28224 [Bradybaena similaris]